MSKELFHSTLAVKPNFQLFTHESLIMWIESIHMFGKNNIKFFDNEKFSISLSLYFFSNGNGGRTDRKNTFFKYDCLTHILALFTSVRDFLSVAKTCTAFNCLTREEFRFFFRYT